MSRCRVAPGIAFVAFCLLLVTACTRDDELPGPVPDGVRTRLAAEGLDSLREALNRGECESIYDNASDAFRQLEVREVWRTRCEDLRSRMGRWASFTVQSTDTERNILLHAGGAALFANGTCDLQSTWSIESGRPRLFMLRLQGSGPEGYMLVVPPPGFPHPREPVDSPPKPPAGQGA